MAAVQDLHHEVRIANRLQAAEKDNVEDIAQDVVRIEQLERDFQDVLTDLVGDQTLERFRVEYEKLHRALKKSVDNEKRLIRKCRELQAALAANAAKVDMALRLTSEDQQTIQAVKAESEKAWKMVEAATEKEARARETIQHLKLEIANLTKLLEQGAGLAEEESSIQDLKRERDMLAAGSCFVPEISLCSSF